MRVYLAIFAALLLLTSPGLANAQVRSVDLSVSDVQAPGEILVGEAFTLSARIRCRGSQSASFRWSVYLTVNGAIHGALRLADFGPVTINGGSTLTVQERVTPPMSLTGRHRIAIVVDADNQLAERNEYDNTALAADFTRIRSPLADLNVAPVQLDTTQTQAGQTVQASFRVDNLGTVAATFNVSAHISRNAAVSTDDPTIGNTTMTLADGQSRSQVLQLNLPSDLTAGDYYVAIIADPESSVSELQETNNIGFATQTININSPQIAIVTSDLPSGTVFIEYYARIAAVGGDGHFSYAINAGRLPQGLSLDAATGLITGKPLESGVKSFTVIAQSAGLSTQISYELATSPSGIDLVITTPNLGIGTISLPYQAELTAAGGEPPYSWHLLDGALPIGVDLNSSGWLSGIPQIEGKYTISLEVIDGLGDRDVAEFEFLIQSPNVTITTERVPSVALNEVSSFALEASGGRAPYVWQAKSRLPPGMSMSEDGTIEGVPAQVGTHAFRVKVVDSSEAGASDTALFHLTVNEDGLFRIIEAPIEELLTRQKLNYVLRADGGTGALQWQLEPGDRLPEGFELTVSETAPEREMILSGSAFQTLTHGFGMRVKDEAGRVRKTALVIQVNTPTVDSADSCRCVVTDDSSSGPLGGLILVLGGLLWINRRRKTAP
jgi:MYXO-CTERM domain-containing protein